MSNIRSGPRHFFRLTIMRWLLKGSLDKGLILDIGSGDGSLSIALAKQGYNVCAVDSSRQWCEIFKTRIKDSPWREKISIFCSNVEDMDLKAGSFDAVICAEALEHIEDDAGTIRHIYSLLRKGGILMISVPLVNKGWDKSDESGGHHRLYSLNDLNNLLTTAGFSILKTLGWGYPSAKLYNKLIFARWAKKTDSEAETIDPKHLITHIGKNPLVSFILSAIFFIDIIFTPAHKAIGVVLKARK